MAFRLPLFFCNDPDGVNDAGNIAEQREQDIQPEMSSETNLEKHAQGREQDGDNDADNIH